MSAGKPEPPVIPTLPVPEIVPPPASFPVSREMTARSRSKVTVAASPLTVRLRRTSVSRVPSVVMLPVTTGAEALPEIFTSMAAVPSTSRPCAAVCAATAEKGNLPEKAMESGRLPAMPREPPPESDMPP
ncbi:hypothetical protein D3C71_1675880 [compost metagenome]